MDRKAACRIVLLHGGVMSIDPAFPDLISSAVWKETHDVR